MYLKLRKFVYDYFGLKRHNTNIRTELVAAITNYFTLLYIVTLVPEILMEAFPYAISNDGVFMPSAIVLGDMTANEVLISLTAISFITAGIASIFMGFFVNVPFIQGPSLTIGTFITYTVCRGFGYTYSQALAIVFISGVLFFVLSITGTEERLHNMIPKNLKYAVSGGIGMYVLYQGLLKAHIINPSDDSGMTFVNLQHLNSEHGMTAMLAIAGVVLIIFLIKKHVHGAIFIGKIACILAAIPLGLTSGLATGNAHFNIKLTPLLFSMDFNGLIDRSGMKPLLMSLASVVIIVFAICIMDIFETISVTIAMDYFLDKNPEEKISVKQFPRMLEVDAVTTATGAALGMTSVSTYVESTTGIVEGGRTGLTAVITGVLFILSIVVTPLASAVPSAATATTLIMAGVMMMGVLKYIDFEDASEAVPAVLTIFLMPLTNRIIIGISVGIISYVLCNIFLVKEKKVNGYLLLLSIFMLIVLIFATRI